MAPKIKATSSSEKMPPMVLLIYLEELQVFMFNNIVILPIATQMEYKMQTYQCKDVLLQLERQEEHFNRGILILEEIMINPIHKGEK